MWECPRVSCMGLIFFGVRVVFSRDVCHVFPHSMLAIIPFIGGVTDALVTRACAGY